MNGTLKFLFLPGRIVSTRGAIQALMEEGCGTSDLLRRHMSGDWGDVGLTGAQENQRALADGFRIFSVYILPRTKVRIWVITEADRSATTLLLPEEY